MLPPNILADILLAAFCSTLILWAVFSDHSAAPMTATITLQEYYHVATD